MAEAVKVAVRVRPFNSRENDRNAKCIIKMNGKATTITDPSGNADPKTFSFDYSYWSHDSFTDEDGLLVASSPKYASQRDVFDNLGNGVLKNAFEGYNTSLFAYGQTGSGKSFSMVGYGKNTGIVPITCEELFKTIDQNTDAETKYEVWFSMLEIYNEQVRDLLSGNNPKGGLPVKQNPKLGLFYVQNLKKVAVGSYPEIERRIDEGTNNRTVAATQMNATSSRAHTVVTITFNQVKTVDGAVSKKESSMNLVDLAGSERADSTGATGDRLKEGANINKSLSSLGNVISALADLSTNPKKKIVVPYRDSTLTKLLMNALGGNSKTIMIAALSPADINYDETLGTLRYADRAKKIKNKATVNENPMDKLLRELREENEKLKKQLAGGGIDESQLAGLTEAEKEKERERIREEMRDQLAANAENFGMMDFDGARAAAQTEDKVLQDLNTHKVLTVPHLTNLNEDPQLSQVVKIVIDEGETTLGRKDGSPEPKVKLTGLGIQKQHAVIQNDGKELTIKPASPGAKVRVNGQPLSGERSLYHNDRLILGSNNMYLFLHPGKKEELSDSTPKDATIDFDFVQKEIAENSGFSGDTTGLSKDQARLQEQIMELLPQMAEVNAVSEELDKYRHFEPVILASTGPENEGAGTKLMVRVKNLQNDNVWLWERGKFINRRFIMQEMYQQYIDNDDSWKQKAQNEDPFWDPPEPILIGHSTVFLQSLAFALDFEDGSLAVTDHKGSEEANLSIGLIPCNKKGNHLGEDEFVEDSNELVGKPFYFKVAINSAVVHNSRYNNGLFAKFKFGKSKVHETKKVKGTLEPKWNYEQIVQVDNVSADDIDMFENGAINVYLYAEQIDQTVPKARAKLTTKELKEQQGSASAMPNMMSRSKGGKSDIGNSQSNAQLTQQMATTSRRLEYLERRDKRIQELCKEWQDKISKDPSVDAKPFVSSINTIIFSGNKFKTRVKVISSGQGLELFDFEMHPDGKEAWISGAYVAVDNLGEVRNRSMSIVPGHTPTQSVMSGQTVSGIKGKSGRRESISAALLAGKMPKPMMNSNAIIEEEEEEDEKEEEVTKTDLKVKVEASKTSSRKASNASALRATKSQDKATGGAKGSDVKSSGGKAAGNKAQSGACSIQ